MQMVRLNIQHNQDLTMGNQFRIKGIHKELGKMVYLSYANHKNQTFFNFDAKPTRLTNIIWECNDSTITRRYAIMGKANSKNYGNKTEPSRTNIR